MKHDLLLEIGCEELPKLSLESLSHALAERLAELLLAAHLEHLPIRVYATPRRLALIVPELIADQPHQSIERFGPNRESAFDKEGTPTMACMGFAKSCGVSIDQLAIQKTDKGERVVCRVTEKGGKTADIIGDIIKEAIKKLPIAKPMRWGNHDVQFVRPVHWVVLLYGKDLIPATILGKETCSQSMGHRFMHPKPLVIHSPNDYVSSLEKAYVIADFRTRKENIRTQLEKLHSTHAQVIIDDDLLSEVTALVEWPVALKGKFNPDFLHVPKEVLITSMKSHQKCFPVVDASANLISEFILVSNIKSRDPAVVIKGNERVINARLSDAAFFFGKDQKISLADRLPRLDSVLFQKQLGSIGDKTKRVAELAKTIAKKIGVNPIHAERAALLSKCDLVSDMVGEFPDLQGIMGYHYAIHDGEDPAVALAIKEHYFPRFSGDILPSSQEGASVALADKLDTLIGIFGINQIPTGDKDPFALRRMALGIIRILIEKNFPLDLMELLALAKAAYKNTLVNENTLDQTFQFLMNRLKAWYLEGGIHPNVFESVFAKNPTSPLDFHHRVIAVQQFQTLVEAEALAAANKRVSNILKKTTGTISLNIDATLFTQDEERNLANSLTRHTKAVSEYYQNANYAKALCDLSSLKEPVDLFFDKVMVMAEDENTRNNRLALLLALRTLFTQVADISLLS
jgi:glycyl-tRNA synthetase beta chain